MKVRTRWYGNVQVVYFWNHESFLVTICTRWPGYVVSEVWVRMRLGSPGGCVMDGLELYVVGFWFCFCFTLFSGVCGVGTLQVGGGAAYQRASHIDGGVW